MSNYEKSCEKVKALIDVLNKNAQKAEKGDEHQNIGFCFYTLVEDKFDIDTLSIVDLTGIFYGEKLFNGEDLIALLKEYIEYIKKSNIEEVKDRRNYQLYIAVEMFQNGETEISERDVCNIKTGYSNVLLNNVRDYLKIFEQLKI